MIHARSSMYFLSQFYHSSEAWPKGFLNNINLQDIAHLEDGARTISHQSRTGLLKLRRPVPKEYYLGSIMPTNLVYQQAKEVQETKANFDYGETRTSRDKRD